MKISCEIIQDLLPLYAEDMIRPATKEMVEEHLCECNACSAELEALRQPQQIPVEVEVNSLKRVGDAIRRRRILAVMAVFLFVATVLLGGALMLDAKIYLSAGEAVEVVSVEENGVKIHWCNGITGTSAAADTDDPTNYSVTAFTNLYNKLFPSEIVPYEELDEEIKLLMTKEQYELFDNSAFYELEHPEDTNFIYVDPGENSMTVILDAGQPFPDAPMMEVYPDTQYYVIGMAALCILCLLASMLWKGKWYGELLGRLSILLGSLALSAVIVTAGQLNGLKGDFQEALVDSTAVALPMCLFGLCIRQLIKLNRRDKGL